MSATATERADRRRRLVEGLVGPAGHLYRTHATYKATVDAVADLLTLWLDNVAAEAREQAEALDVAIGQAMRGEPWQSPPLLSTTRALLSRLALTPTDSDAESTPSRPVLDVTP